MDAEEPIEAIPVTVESLGTNIAAAVLTILVLLALAVLALPFIFGWWMTNYFD